MRQCKGLTLIEILVGLAIISILIGIGVPAMQNMISNSKLNGVTESLYSDMQLARSEAIKTNQTIFVVFQTGANWCYGLSTNNACNCATGAACAINNRTYIGRSSNYTGITLNSLTFAGSRTSFTPRRGTAVAGTATFGNANNSTSIVVSSIGRVRACGTLGGLPGC